MMLDDLQVRPAIERSAQLVKRRWTQAIATNLAIGLQITLITMPLIAVIAVVAAFSPASAVIIGTFCCCGLIAVGTATQVVVDVAVFKFAEDGQGHGPFSADELQHRFRSSDRPRRPRAGEFG